MFEPTKRWLLAALGTMGVLGCKPISAAEAEPSKVAAYTAKVMAAFPYEIVSVPGQKALETWGKLKGAGRGYPVIVGGDEDLMLIADQFALDIEGMPGATPENRQTPAQILEAAKAIRFPDVLRTLDEALSDKDVDEMMGEWPTRALAEEVGLSVATDILTDKFLKTVHIVLVPARASWEVPAYLQWGGWNACPMPGVHVAALRSWNERFGAELIGISPDVLNVRVPKPLADRQKAMELAKEMYRYCPDIVDQGVGEVAVLAACLMAHRWWFFWWD